MMGLPLNRALRDESGRSCMMWSPERLLVVGLGEEDFAS